MCSQKPPHLNRIFRLVAIVLLCGACMALTSQPKADEHSLLNLVLSSLTLHGTILIGTGIVLWSSGKSWRETFGFAKRPVIGAIFWGALAAVLFLPVGMLLQELSLRLLDAIHVAAETQTAVEELDKASSRTARIYLIVFAVTLAPVAEEVLFRGIIFGVIKKLGYRRLAFWLSALLFAAIHENLPIFAPLLALGLVLAWLYERTGNLLASISAHATFNAINVVILVYGDYFDKWIQPRLHHWR